MNFQILIASFLLLLTPLVIAVPVQNVDSDDTPFILQFTNSTTSWLGARGSVTPPIGTPSCPSFISTDANYCGDINYSGLRSAQFTKRQNQYMPMTSEIESIYVHNCVCFIFRYVSHFLDIKQHN
jgi:hypothetical protein